MNDFLRFVLHQLQNSLWLVLLALVAGIAVTALVYIGYRRKYQGTRKFPWGGTLLYLVFAGYLTVVLFATVLRYSGGYRDWNLHLFRAWREAWNNFSMKNWLNVLLNVAMFVPFGALLPLLYKKFRHGYVTVPVGFAFSLTLELIQLATARGVCDVDDLFTNTMGTWLGYVLAMLLLSMFREKGKRLKPMLGYTALILAFLGCVSGIFLAYSQKELGNLPMAPAYTNNTSKTQWDLRCTLPEAQHQAAVYRTETLSIKDCDAFAARIAALDQGEISMASYYQDFAYYNLTFQGQVSTYLLVYYFDGSFEYGTNKQDGIPANADRAAWEAVLQRYPITIPEQAEFSADGDGKYSFAMDRVVDGDVMWDGVLSCRCDPDGTLSKIDNKLIAYTYYREGQIMTAEEAYQRLRDGQFNDGGYFEHKKPASIAVTDCDFGYEIDTKGFYQPVYYFEVAAGAGGYTDRIMIPALT